MSSVRKPLLYNDSPVVEKMKAQKRQASTKLAGANELEVRALTDMKAFAELINFHGGWSNFGEVHSDLVDFLTVPQLDRAAQEALKYDGDEYRAHLRRLVLMSRGHLKSTVGTVLYTLWRIYRNPEIRILVACNLQSLAYSFIRELRSYLENPELLPIWNKRPHIAGNLIPAIQKKSNARNFNSDTDAEDRKVIWNNVALQVVRRGKYKEPTVFATSVGTTITGMHFDLVIEDDLVDFKNVESEVKKEQVEEWIADIESVLNPPNVTFIEGRDGFKLSEVLGGEVIVTGTRYALDDYYGQVIEKQLELGYQVFQRNIFRNGKDATDGYTWHEKYTDNLVNSLRARLSARRFSSQYLNVVYEKDAHLFDSRAIQVISDESVFSYNTDICVSLPNGRREVLNPIIAIDPAFSTSKTGDDCAIVVGAKLSDGSLLVIDAALDRMVAAEVVTTVRDFAEKYRTLRLFSESNGVGMLVPELFKPESSYVNGKPIIVNGHYEQRTKESKIQGVLELPINAGRLILLQRVRSQEYIWKQITNYPGVRHDDFLDGLVTLYEKSLPSRKVFKDAMANVSFDSPILKINTPSYERTSDENQGYLNQFRAVVPT